jgi:hypothetical protein
LQRQAASEELLPEVLGELDALQCLACACTCACCLSAQSRKRPQDGWQAATPSPAAAEAHFSGCAWTQRTKSFALNSSTRSPPSTPERHSIPPLLRSASATFISSSWKGGASCNAMRQC